MSSSLANNDVAASGGTSAASPSTAVRRCIASGELLPKRRLIRFVAGPRGQVVPDLAGRLPGRGLWLSPRRDMLEKACARNLFARAAKAPLRASDDLVGQVDRLLVRRCLDLFGLAKRAGQVVSGYEKVSSWLAAGKLGLLVQAVDAAEDGRRRLRAMAAARAPEVPVVELFTREELGQALGRDNWVHVAIAPGGVARQLIDETARLAALRGRPEDPDRGGCGRETYS